MIERVLPSGLTTLIRSLRIRWRGEPLPERCVVAFWHSQMIAGWWIARKNAVAMVSRSQDGEYLSKILSKWKYKLVRGSTASNGIEALEEAIAMMRSGEANRLVLTPDGPRGPCEVFKRGAFVAAKELDVPLYFLSIKYNDGMQLLKSWDKFQIPYPFSSVIIRPYLIETKDFPEDFEEQKIFLEKASNPFRSVPIHRMRRLVEA